MEDKAVQSIVEFRILRINALLDKIKRDKITFNSLWGLAKYLADAFNESIKKDIGSDSYPTIKLDDPGTHNALKLFNENKSKPITASTLIDKRSCYREIITHFYNEISYKTKNVEAMSTALTSSLEVNNLKHELKEAKRTIKKLQEQLSDPLPGSIVSVDSYTIDACHKLVLSLLEVTEDIVVFDNGRLLDLTKSQGNNEIASEELLKKSQFLKSPLMKLLALKESY